MASSGSPCGCRLAVVCRVTSKKAMSLLVNLTVDVRCLGDCSSCSRRHGSSGREWERPGGTRGQPPTNVVASSGQVALPVLRTWHWASAGRYDGRHVQWEKQIAVPWSSHNYHST